MLISVTLLCSYLYCKRKLYIEQVLGIKEIPKEVTVKGSIRHNVLDWINKQEKSLVLSVNENNINEIPNKYINFYSKNLTNSIKMNKSVLDSLNIKMIDAYKEIWPFFKDDATTRSNYLLNFVNKHKMFGQQLWEQLTPKILTEVYIRSDKLELKGKIDRIEIHENKQIPVEIKSGNAPREGVWESHLIQIAAYMMLMQEKYGNKVGVGKVHYLKNLEDREIKMNPALFDDVVKLKNKVKELLSSKQIPDFCGNENKCESCGLKKECFGIKQ